MVIKMISHMDLFCQDSFTTQTDQTKLETQAVFFPSITEEQLS